MTNTVSGVGGQAEFVTMTNTKRVWYGYNIAQNNLMRYRASQIAYCILRREWSCWSRLILETGTPRIDI